MRMQLFQHPCQGGISNRLAIDADALVPALRMGRAEYPDTSSAGPQHGFQHERGGALALGAGDMNATYPLLRIAGVLQQRQQTGTWSAARGIGRAPGQLVKIIGCSHGCGGKDGSCCIPGYLRPPPDMHRTILTVFQVAVATYFCRSLAHMSVVIYILLRHTATVMERPRQ